MLAQPFQGDRLTMQLFGLLKANVRADAAGGFDLFQLNLVDLLGAADFGADL